VGVLVADIAAARERFAAVTGMTFTPATAMRFENFEDARGPRTIEITVCYSLEGPPYLELVQWDPEGGIFGSQLGEGLHHLGFHDPDVPARLAGLQGEHGVSAASRRHGNRHAERLHAFMTVAADLHGVRLEVVDEEGRLALQDWLGSFIE
jgi:hypothetical protein